MITLKRGFTFIEVIVAIVIVAILLAIAIPSYQLYLLKGRRVDALQTISAIQLAQEKYRVSNTTYGTLAQVWGGVTATEGGFYTIAVSNNTATSYTITATAVGSQANDADGSTSCSSLVLTYNNGTTSKTPAACWMTN